MDDVASLPFQTAFDPPQTAEGSLDPLGLYSIADRLGVLLAPGVRERQRTPRFLTLALVGHLICRGLDDDADPETPPAWLVFEWLVVASLVMQLQGSDDLKGIPGREKVKASLGDGICTSNYLKSPSVFGFHGVYRVLGVKAGLFDQDGRILGTGHSILQAWQQDQNLGDFLAAAGPEIRGAVQVGKNKRSITAPSRSVREWIAAHLNPYRPGRKEQEALWSALVQTDERRGQYAMLLVSDEGQREWVAANGSESKYQAGLIGRAHGGMKPLLEAIQKFERLARLLVDAFDEARACMTEEKRPVDYGWLGRGECMRRAAQDGGGHFKDALKALEVDPGMRHRLEQQFAWMGEATSAPAFAAQLISHHDRVQRDKPPSGKRPWIDTFGDGRVAVRRAFDVEKFIPRTNEYVHGYRTVPIWQFSKDLGRVKKKEEA